MDVKEKKDSEFSFIQEKVKQKPIYQNKMVKKCISSILLGILFSVTALAVWSYAIPRMNDTIKQQELQPIELPEETETPDIAEESTVYITETISMELKDYKQMYKQLLQIASQAEKSLVQILASTVDTDWFDETYTSQSLVSGSIIGDNGLELLILTEYHMIEASDNLLVTFFDHATANAVLKKYDKNTDLAIVSVNLSDISKETKEIISYADLGSSKTLRSGEPLIALGSPSGTSDSVIFGNLTSASQNSSLYDGAYNVLTTDMLKNDMSSGVLVNWSGQIVGLIQSKCEVIAQEQTIQAYGISDVKNVIEHLSNNQDVVYMGILGADVTTAISNEENIPIGVYVSEVAFDSPALEAGILPGDIITSISGQSITNQKDIASILLKCSNLQSVQVLCQRLGQGGYEELEFTVTLKILD